ncbi:50S ribosomal protein L24 [Candidatus Saccharibacteria bacterium]|nr:50S ribosomal protein L24 [Candidatus Saccharibacteria bacterium]
MKLRKGDLVTVISGRLKGQSGRVTAVHPKLNKVTVENLNLVKKHAKPSQEHPQGGILDVVKPLAVSKVALVEPKSGRPSRVGFRTGKDGGKQRVYKRGGQPVRGVEQK